MNIEELCVSKERELLDKYYKSLLRDYTRNVLTIMRLDFLEEITGHHISNKTFSDD